MKGIKKNKVCRMCRGKNLRLWLDLGNMALANSFLKTSRDVKYEYKYPLRVFFCEDCYLNQLTHIVDPNILFKNYVYFSKRMPDLPKHFKDYAKEVVKDFTSSKNDLVVEIGSNDGVLIGEIGKMGRRILGVDPALNIAKVANAAGIKTLPKFFSAKLSKQIVKKYGSAKAIIGNNVVAHINDHLDLVSAVKHLLSKDGVFIFEAPYLVDMFENLTFDTVYHEHLSYLSIHPLKKMLEKSDMEIFEVKIFPVQGNSIRVYVGNKNMHKIRSSVEKILNKEKAIKLHKFSTYKKLATIIEKMKIDVVRKIKRLKKEGKVLAGYGAPAKGNTLLNYYGIDSKMLDYVTEELPSKIGYLTPGTHIKVIDIEQSRKNPPDYYLLLAWNYKDNILQKEKNFTKSGGKFIMPVGKTRFI